MNAIRHELRFYLTTDQLTQLTEGVAEAMMRHMGCVDIVRAGAVVLSDVCRAVVLGKMRPLQEHLATRIANVATLVAKAYLDTEAAALFYENEVATFVYDAVRAVVRRASVAELVPVLLMVVRSATTQSKPPSHAHLTCAALGEAFQCMRSAVAMHLSAAVEAVLSLLKTHGDASFKHAKAAVYALSVMCTDDAALDVFTVCDGLRIVTSTVTTYARTMEQWLDSNMLKNAGNLFQLLAHRAAKHAAEFGRAKEERDRAKPHDVKYPF